MCIPMKVNWKNDAYLQVISMAAQNPVGHFIFFTLPTYTNNPQIEGKYGIRPHILYVENPNSRQFQQRIQK